MASSSVSQEDHDVEHEIAIASRRAKVRSARANRAVNYPCRDTDKDGDVVECHIPKYEQNAAVLAEQNDSSPKPLGRVTNKDKRVVSRVAYAGKNNKGVRDRRKLREKRRSTGVMHVPSTESTGGSTGEDENIENAAPAGSSLNKSSAATVEPDTIVITSSKQDRSESDLDADDEANNSGDVRGSKDEMAVLKTENEKLSHLLKTKEKRIAALEMQVAQLTLQMSEIREENSKLLRIFGPKASP